MTTQPDWLTLNLANWNERVPIHLDAPGPHYKLDALKNRTQTLDPIAADILGPVDGLHILHLQCHFGADTLTIAQHGATVTGLDFSPPAITTANALATELDLTAKAHFVAANVYDAEAAINQPAAYDRVFVSWGALNWLPDVNTWARIVASFLKPNGYLALADAHPVIYVFDDLTATPDGMPGWYAPYLARQPLHEDRADDYADPTAHLKNSRTVEFLHPISDVIMALINAGLRIDRFHEHDSIAWQAFAQLHRRGPNDHVWPDKPWLPLSYSLRASKPQPTC
jgi:SAM-dependent methyltransferase